ncbi:YegP family protein, partial [Kitasatospora purpeofusca]|uniref:YegP family protein n=1 Tax=Kitasatospora purpeofusca TaxID=67352 RepID=UPI00367B88B6
MAGKFEVYEDAGGKFRFRLKAGNGEIVATGQGYASKDVSSAAVSALSAASSSSAAATSAAARSRARSR